MGNGNQWKEGRGKQFESWWKGRRQGKKNENTEGKHERDGWEMIGNTWAIKLEKNYIRDKLLIKRDWWEMLRDGGGMKNRMWDEQGWERGKVTDINRYGDVHTHNTYKMCIFFEKTEREGEKMCERERKLEGKLKRLRDRQRVWENGDREWQSEIERDRDRER